MAMRDKAGYQPKKRNAHSRARRSVILLATEGKNQTETQYFRDFSGEYNKELQKYHPGYTKSTEKMFEQTKDKLITAISNAEKLWKACQSQGEQPHTVAFTPSTEISELVQKLMN